MASQYYPNGQAPVYPTGPNDQKLGYNYQAVTAIEDEDRLNKAAEADRRIKRRIRILRGIQRIANLIFSVFVLGIMLNTYLTYTNNRTAKTSNGSTVAIYPTQPETWPTFMMIGTAAASLIFNFAILASYCRSIGAANRVSNYASYWGYLVHVVNIAVWLATTTTFKKMQGAADAVPPPNDLWGWTCSNAADELKAQLPGIVDFELQCTTQQVSFAVGLVNVGLEILSIIINIIAIRRMLQKKKLAKLESRQSAGLSPTY